MMIKPTLSFLSLSLFLCLLNENCFSQRFSKPRYNNKDSAATISIHPGRLFKYGFAFNREESEGYRSLMEIYGIQNGQTVADVGAASGWLEGVFSVMTDSVTYYVQDIDTVYLNEDQLGKVVSHFSSLRSTPQTNQFKLVIGTKSKTNLPDNTFDRIIINNTFHEFTAINKMLRDIATKLKPGGQVIVGEPMSTDFKKVKHPGCRIEAYAASKVIEYFSENGFFLTGMMMPENSPRNFLSFELNEAKAKEYDAGRTKVSEPIRELDKFHHKSVRLDSALSNEVIKKVQPYINDIIKLYPKTEQYLNQLGYDLLEDNKTKEAINVFRANVAFFPASANVYDSLAEAFMLNGNFALSIENYNRSLLLDPGNKNAQKKIAEMESKR